MQNLFYALKIIWYRIIKKDTNRLIEIRTERLRSKGAKIGQNLRVFSNISTPETYLIEIGNDVVISTNVKLITHDNSLGMYHNDITDSFGKIKIGDRTFIGEGTIILPGIELSDNIIVGAGSVVTKSFKQSGVIIAGNPARIIGNVQNYSKKYYKNGFNTAGLSFEEKKRIILENEKKLLNK
ncbi:acyltransferase [Aerococcaceae bacterium WS4759]|uniref:Acyltransferase n=1 Tax=Fundicoccus ignavus TaxID=2664442 RepID=A0A6I2GBM0_9LACT|nr:acyltransferase [Fundicoccus ignavus]MRI84626.1 acyltransferase [Fundicoccus ignavus]